MTCALRAACRHFFDRRSAAWITELRNSWENAISMQIYSSKKRTNGANYLTYQVLMILIHHHWNFWHYEKFTTK